jgi:ABC-type multidrug transport system permease subunit
MLGAVLNAQDFEFRTIVEYRLAPTPTVLILGTRLVRLALSAFLSAGLLCLSIRLFTGASPTSIPRVFLVLIPIAISAGCLGTIAGLLLQSTIPSFVIALTSTLLCWIVGSSFGLAGGFGGLYEIASWFSPNTYAVELLFPLYYGAPVGSPGRAAVVLALGSAVMLALTAVVYRWRVQTGEG